MLHSGREILKPNEKILMVRTNGDHFDRDEMNGDASVGKWRIKVTHPIDRVVIYHEHSKYEDVDVYIGDFVRIESRDGDGGKQTVYVTRLHSLGRTSASWSEFSNDGKTIVSHIRYLFGQPD